MSPTETITTTTTTKTDRHRFRRTLALVVALAVLAAGLAMALAAGDAQDKKVKPPASAPAGPMIAFTSNRDGNQEIYSMNSDGSNLRNLTNNPASDTEPEISPDGTKIAFVSTRDGILNPEIYTMNADGSNQQRLTKDDTNVADVHPTWSPDGGRIAFASNRDGNQEIYTMNAADGSGQENLTNNPARDSAPAYSPAATNASGTSTIAFETNRTGNTEIFFMDNHGNNPYQLTNNPTGDFGVTYAPDPIDHWNRAFTRVVPTQDGGYNYEIYQMSYLAVTQTNLTNSPATETDPSYSPEGTKIAFTTDRAGNEEIYSMNRDGSSPTNLTNNAAGDEDPDWGVASLQ